MSIIKDLIPNINNYIYISLEREFYCLSNGVCYISIKSEHSHDRAGNVKLPFAVIQRKFQFFRQRSMNFGFYCK